MRNKPEKKCSKGKTGKKERIYHYCLYRPPNKQQNNHGSWFKKKNQTDMHTCIHIPDRIYIYMIIIQLQKLQKITVLIFTLFTRAFFDHIFKPQPRDVERSAKAASEGFAHERLRKKFHDSQRWCLKPNKHSSKKPGCVNCSPFLQISIQSVNHPFRKFNEAEDPGTI